MSLFRCLILAALAVVARGATTTPAPSPAPGTYAVCDLCGFGGSNYTIGSPGTLVTLTGFPPVSCLTYYQQAVSGSISPSICSIIAGSYKTCKCLIAGPPSIAPSIAPVAPTKAPVVAATTSAPTPAKASSATGAPSMAPAASTPSAPIAGTATAPTSAPVASPGSSSSVTGTSGGNSWYPASLLLGVTLFVGTVAIM